MALDSKMANRILFTVLGTFAGLGLLTVSVIGYYAYQRWRLDKEINDSIPPYMRVRTPPILGTVATCNWNSGSVPAFI
jgi:hypothetical protein